MMNAATRAPRCRRRFLGLLVRDMRSICGTNAASLASLNSHPWRLVECLRCRLCGCLTAEWLLLLCCCAIHTTTKTCQECWYLYQQGNRAGKTRTSSFVSIRVVGVRGVSTCVRCWRVCVIMTTHIAQVPFSTTATL